MSHAKPARGLSAAAGRGVDARSRRDSASGGSLSRNARLSGATGEAGLDCSGFGLNRCPRSTETHFFDFAQGRLYGQRTSDESRAPDYASYNRIVDSEPAAKAKLFAETAYSAAQDKIIEEFQRKLADAQADLGNKGLRHSSAMNAETTRLYAERVKTQMQAKLDALLEGYELCGVTLDEQIKTAILSEVELLRAQTVGGTASGVRGQMQLNAQRTNSISGSAKAAADEFGRALERLTHPMLKDIKVQIERRMLTSTKSTNPSVTTTREVLSNTGIKVFISHSSADVEIATALIDLLRYAIPNLDPPAIRCSTVPGYKLSGGADTDDTLREEMRHAPVFIALLTKRSLGSTYVLFELGARWGAGSKFTPLVAAGLQPSELQAPLHGLHAQSCDSETDLHQVLTEVAELLGLKLVGAHVYDSHLKNLVKVSKTQALKRSAATATGVALHPPGDKQPRIEQLQLRRVHLHRDQLDQWSITSSHGGSLGLIVPFYYDPKSEARPEIYVRAHIVFTDKDSGFRIIVPAACWVGEYLNVAAFKPGDEKSVLLLADDSQRNSITCKSRRAVYDDFSSPVGLVEDIAVPLTAQIVEITLFWSEDRETETYRFELPDRRAPVVRAQ